MSADALTNGYKRTMDAMASQAGMPRRGIVQDFNPQTHCAQVQIMPDGQLSGWIPVLSGWVGNGWGLVAPLQTGDQVLMLPEDGDPSNYVVVGRYFSQVDPPPGSVASGEMWLVHQSGAKIALKADGSISLITATLNVTAPSGDATVNIAGQIIVSKEATIGGIPFTPHTHGNVQNGGGVTDPPQG